MSLKQVWTLVVLTALASFGAGCVTSTPAASGGGQAGAPVVEVLPNGLTLIVHDHRAADIVAVHLWVATGVRYETPETLEDVATVRWRQFRIYPKQFVNSPGNPAMYGLAGIRLEGNGFPAVFNIEADPREEVNVLGTNAWVIGPYLKVIGEYRKTLEKHPNPKAVNMTDFGR